MGQHAADWLQGESIPQAMDILPRALKVENIAQYEADLADPTQVFSIPRVVKLISGCMEISVMRRETDT
jgi:ribose transport system substrate-binding protein